MFSSSALGCAGAGRSPARMSPQVKTTLPLLSPTDTGPPFSVTVVAGSSVAISLRIGSGQPAAKVNKGRVSAGKSSGSTGAAGLGTATVGGGATGAGGTAAAGGTIDGGGATTRMAVGAGKSTIRSGAGGCGGTALTGIREAG